MIEQLSQDTIAEYASDAQTIQEPQGSDYSQGVAVGKTIPAKWWNWLFRAVTRRAGQSKADAQDMLTEMQNVVTDAGITLDSTDNTQLSQAIEAKSDIQIVEYVHEKRKFATYWQDIETTGLLPFPGASLSYSSSHWCLFPQKAGDFFWSIHGIENNASGSVFFDTPSVAFSKDLKKWHTIELNNIDQYFGNGFLITAGVVFFKGTYYMCISSVAGRSTDASKYVILSSQDTEHWEVEVRTQTTLPGDVNGPGPGLICVLYNKIICFTGKYIYKSSDGVNWAQENLPSGMRPYMPTPDGYRTSQLLSQSVMPIPFGSKYLFGEVLIDENSITPIYVDADRKALIGAKMFKLAQGNVVVGKYTIDSSFNVTVNSDLVSILGILQNNKYLIVQREGVTGYSFTEDGLTFTAMTSPTTSEVITGEGCPVCEFDGKFYYSQRNGERKMFVSDNLIDWTYTGVNAPLGATLKSIEEMGVLVSASECTYDKGTTWLQSESSSGGYVCPTHLLDIMSNRYYATQEFSGYVQSTTYVTYSRMYYAVNDVNRVIGHTLYLR